MIQGYQKGSRMSQAVCYGGFVYIVDAEDRKAGIEDLTSDVLGKIDALLKEAGIDHSRLIAVNRLPAGDRRFRRNEQRHDGWIDVENPPARACLEARLADRDLRVEMTAVAAL
ncbi:endoribonuclease L-PSP protein (plasmid) [Rhizobium gallicum bv. gallicum R602sp]|uniref:Endoribonuclease L-PSP protein n=1 Tax=Rhizobium gallicum bv. gallicum R602sp TaxID=1041138 RepID=A0A0B4XD25_9HYPH|nr:Rid family hydrolase [Rhizobium gallicum]AJD44437.1 endoribonuclease L-PSP protein [Rhizobium gallicum bv. gallicum R602sp]TDW20311.1 enamine deaminase RidA (YjgF/YER057c/UK114 family) [Rhizobium azibense]